MERNRDQQREYFREYIKNARKDPFQKLKQSLRKRTHLAFQKHSWKKGGSEKLLGCSFEEAKEHIENLFTEGMHWHNHGNCEECWHIDHIIPFASATTQEELITLCHYTNLQPLWRFDNLSKGSKIY